MTTTQFNTLVQMIAALSARIEEVAQKQDQFITKKDAEAFATKKDLEEMANTILEALQVPFAQHERILKNHNLHV